MYFQALLMASPKRARAVVCGPSAVTATMRPPARRSRLMASGAAASPMATTMISEIELVPTGTVTSKTAVPALDGAL